MPRLALVVSLAIAALALVTTPGHAGSSGTITYVATPGLTFSLDQAPAGIGGYNFMTPSKPLTLDVDDVNGNGVRVTVCQENASDPVAGDLDNVCGDGGDDVRVVYCTNGSPRNIGPQNFRPNSPFTVFVRTDGPALGCSQVGVAGTIVLTW
jgi:hypothetical protein